MFSTFTTRHQRPVTPRAAHAWLAAGCAVVFLVAAPSALAQELVIATAPPR